MWRFVTSTLNGAHWTIENDRHIWTFECNFLNRTDPPGPNVISFVKFNLIVDWFRGHQLNQRRTHCIVRCDIRRASWNRPTDRPIDRPANKQIKSPDKKKGERPTEKRPTKCTKTKTTFKSADLTLNEEPSNSWTDSEPVRGKPKKANQRQTHRQIDNITRCNDDWIDHKTDQFEYKWICFSIYAFVCPMWWTTVTLGNPMWIFRFIQIDSLQVQWLASFGSTYFRLICFLPPPRRHSSLSDRSIASNASAYFFFFQIAHCDQYVTRIQRQ